MTTFVVWMDMDLAKVFKVQLGEPKLKVLRRKQILHHTSRDPKNHKDGRKFYDQIAKLLSGADEILLMGPGLAKEHFKAHLESHPSLGLADNIVGSETVDHISDPEIIAASHKFFQMYDVYGKSLGELRGA